jgi:hypothetical protein
MLATPESPRQIPCLSHSDVRDSGTAQIYVLVRSCVSDTSDVWTRCRHSTSHGSWGGSDDMVSVPDLVSSARKNLYLIDRQKLGSDQESWSRVAEVAEAIHADCCSSAAEPQRYAGVFAGFGARDRFEIRFAISRDACDTQFVYGGFETSNK